MWTHFTSKSSTVVQCNICKAEQAFAGGTGSMKNHLKAKHPSVILNADTSDMVAFSLFYRRRCYAQHIHCMDGGIVIAMISVGLSVRVRRSVRRAVYVAKR